MKLWILIGKTAFWLSWPLLAIYLRFGKRTRVLVVAEGKILVVKGWLGSGKWCLPGGGLHRNEAPLEGVIRETKEETSLLLSKESLRHIDGRRQGANGVSFWCERFIAELGQLQAVRKSGLEIIEVAWLSPEELSKQNASQDVIDLLSDWKKSQKIGTI